MQQDIRTCKKHGSGIYYLTKAGRWICRQCNIDGVSLRRKKNKEALVAAFGGKCCRCGYDRYIGALEFHHKDPKQKDFTISGSGATWSLKRLMEEASKCILVCSNCHKEIHAENMMSEP